MKADFGIMINNHIEKITNSLFAIAPDIFCSRPVLFAYLYGSYSTGNVHPFSDLDIGVYIDDVSDIKYLKLELSLSLEIDVKIGSGVRAEVRIINNLPLVIGAFLRQCLNSEINYTTSRDLIEVKDY